MCKLILLYIDIDAYCYMKDLLYFSVSSIVKVSFLIKILMYLCKVYIFECIAMYLYINI